MSAKVISNNQSTFVEPMRWPSLHGAQIVPALPTPPGALAIAGPRQDPGPAAEAHEAEINRLKAEAEKRIHEALAAGRSQGEAAAREAMGAALNAEIEKVRLVGTHMLSSGKALRKQAEADLVRLAIAIARRILYREVKVDPEALLGLTKAALTGIDQREIQVIRTHPDNVGLVQRVLENGKHSSGRIEISGDARLERGALIIETGRGHLDASVETHLDEIERGFIDLVGNKG